MRAFKGEVKLEGGSLCLEMRGEVEELLGERGGALPAGNMEDKGLLPPFGLEQLPGTFRATPDFASFNNDVTYICVCVCTQTNK